MATENIESTNNKTDAQRVPGVYELAREHLTAHCDGFFYGDPVWMVSAWKYLLNGIPEDVNFARKSAHNLCDCIIEDIGEQAAFSGLEHVDDVSRFVTCIELAAAYGTEEWPRVAMRDYLYAFEDFDEERADVTSRRVWSNAQILYENFKFADGKPEKMAA